MERKPSSELNNSNAISVREQREDLLQLRAQVLLAEEQRISEAKTISISEARELLKNI
jgi:hypothetical protein